MIEQLESAAKQLAQEIGKHNLTREAVCTRAKVAEGSFGYLTGTQFAPWLESLKLPDSDHPIVRSRLAPETRRGQILNRTKELSLERGYVNVEFEDIAKDLNITVELIKHYFPYRNVLIENIMNIAVTEQNYDLIAQGVMNHHPIAMELDVEVKTEAVRAVLMK